MQTQLMGFASVRLQLLLIFWWDMTLCFDCQTTATLVRKEQK